MSTDCVTTLHHQRRSLYYSSYANAPTSEFYEPLHFPLRVIPFPMQLCESTNITPSYGIGKSHRPYFPKFRLQTSQFRHTTFHFLPLEKFRFYYTKLKCNAIYDVSNEKQLRENDFWSFQSLCGSYQRIKLLFEK